MFCVIGINKYLCRLHLPEGYTVETLLGKHTSKPRNPKIANVFYRAGFIESWGRGYEKIMDAFKKLDLTPPTFKVEQGGIACLIPREIFVEMNGLRGGDQKSEQKSIQPDSTRFKTDLKSNQSESKSLIIEMIRYNPKLSYAELANMIGIHKSSVQRRVDALVKEGKIEHVGPSNGGSWKIID